MTNDVPTKLVAVMVTTHNYYYKPSVHKSKLKNILVEKNCSKPIDAQPVKKVSKKLVQRKKEKSGKHKYHVLDKAPRYPPSKLVDLDSKTH
jgi:hypothetical protein